jgi:hypothetical protein
MAGNYMPAEVLDLSKYQSTKRPPQWAILGALHLHRATTEFGTSDAAMAVDLALSSKVSSSKPGALGRSFLRHDGVIAQVADWTRRVNSPIPPASEAEIKARAAKVFSDAQRWSVISKDKLQVLVAGIGRI